MKMVKILDQVYLLFVVEAFVVVVVVVVDFVVVVVDFVVVDFDFVVVVVDFVVVDFVVEVFDVIMARSIETLRRHSGLEFVYAGASLRRAANEFRAGRRGNEAILLDFVPSDELSGNVLENSFPSIDPLVSSRVWWALESADIKMDAQMDGFFWPNHGWGDELVLRRLLEVSGLRGVNSQYEVMNIPLNASERYRMTEFFNMNLELGPGDILGLHAVGAEQGCIVD